MTAPLPPVRRHRQRRLGGLALLLAFGGCGHETPAPERVAAPPIAAGPPTWSMTRDEGALGDTLIDVRADGACHVRIFVEGAPITVTDSASRDFVAGETARLAWRVEALEPAPSSTPVSAEERAAGRTEPHLLLVSYGWSDSPQTQRRVVVGTRPGKGRALPPHNAIPPRTPRPLEFGSDLELGTVAVTDGAADDATLVLGASGSRVKGLLRDDPDARATVVRLLLRAERKAR